MTALPRGEYAARYGPTTGDRVRLADTDLWVEVEADDVAPGDELIGGCGKTARDGVLVSGDSGRDSALDMIIPNILVLDPLLGVRKTSIGIADGRIVGTGRAGADVQSGVDLVVDSHTAIVPGEGLIATAGIIDSTCTCQPRRSRPRRRQGHDDRRHGHGRRLGRGRQPGVQHAVADRRSGPGRR